MDVLLSKPSDWAEAEFSEAALGDARRVKRLVAGASRLAEQAHGTLPKTFSRWSELKAMYRLLSSEAVTHAKVLAGHHRRVRSSCGSSGEYVLIEDTTTLVFKDHPGTAGLGRVQESTGHDLFVHSTLALRVESWGADGSPQMRLLGLYAQAPWVRSATVHHRQSNRDRLGRPRESQRWAAVFSETGGPPPEARWTYVADREGDIYEVFQKCDAQGVDFVIRAARPRALSDADGSIFTNVSERPVLGRCALDLRARPGQRARTATLEVRAMSATLRGPWRPEGWLGPFTVGVVEVREVDPPKGTEPLHWVLLTTHPCETFEPALRVVHTYACRWVVEEFHKALKTGTRVEASQLKTRDRLETLLGILSVIAVRLLATKSLARTDPDSPVDPDDWSPEALEILENKFGRPREGWTHATILRAVARLGGFLNRKSDGPPGWLTIWRGWTELMLLEEGFALARKGGEKCG